MKRPLTPEQLAIRDAREQHDSDGRQMNRVLNFLDGWSCTINLIHNTRRADILACLPHDLDRAQFLDIEPQLAGCTYRSKPLPSYAELLQRHIAALEHEEHERTTRCLTS